MISFRMLSLPMFALVAALAGCSAEQGTTVQPDTASTAQQAAQADDEAKGQGPRGPHRGPPGGPEFLIGASLHAPLDLTDAQRTTIEGLLEDGKKDGPPHRPPPAFDATKAKALADAIRANEVGSQPMPPGPDHPAHVAESAARIKTLHDTLTAEQRTKLVADVESHGGHGAKGPPRVAVHHHGPHGGPPVDLAEDLKLTDAQKEQLKAKFEAKHPKPDLEGMKAEMKSKLESFKADTFDATAFVTPRTPLHPRGDANPLADLVSVLTPEQRETLARKIEAGPPARPQK